MKIPFIPYVQGHNYSRYKDGRPVVTQKYAIGVHITANDATAEQEAAYATRRPDQVSSHLYADNNSVVQSLDTTMRAWHAGSVEGNDNAVAIEFTGSSAWSRERWLTSVAWDLVGKVLAAVCKEYDIPVARPSVEMMANNPRVKGFYGHNDMRLAWGGTTHTCPGPNFPWDKLLTSVNTYLHPVIPPMESLMRDCIIAREKDKAEVFIGNGIIRRHVKDETELKGLQWWVEKRGGDSTVHLFEPGTIGVLGVLIGNAE